VTDKTLGLFADYGMAKDIVEAQNRGDALHVQPTLKEMSVQALEILDCNEQGFVAVSSNFNAANSE